MKKLYKKGKVHPSPPLISDHLAFLPATILCLTVALSPEDKEVLAYLISCSGAPTSFNGGGGNSNKKNTQNTQNQKSLINGVGTSSSIEHPPMFQCDCFRCYTSFWVRWDSSPNRQLIHEIIEAFEDELSEKKMMMINKKEKKKKGNNRIGGLDEMKRFEEIGNRVVIDEMGGVIESVEKINEEEIGDEDGDEEEMDLDTEKGSMRRFMSFVGERIWGVWGQ